MPLNIGKAFQSDANSQNQTYEPHDGELRDRQQPTVELAEGLNGAASHSHHLTPATIRLSKSCNTNYTSKM